MNDYIILTDSSCDLPADLEKLLEVEVVPLTVNIDGKDYAGYLDEREIKFRDFYDKMRADATVFTSAVNVHRFMESMGPILESGKDILCISFSSGLSNTYNAAVLASQELKEKYPDRNVLVIDSLCASLGQGLLVYLAVMEKEKGRSMEEVKNFVEDIRLNVCHWFTVDDLKYLRKGGRISHTTEVIGNVLHIKPVLHVDNEGHLISMAKARGRKASLRMLFDRVLETAFYPEQQIIFISHADAPEEAEALAKEFREKLGVKDVVTGFVGPVIGAHTGPGLVAVFYLGTER